MTYCINRLLQAMSTPKGVLAASETLRHILDFLSLRPGGNLCSKPVAERL